MSILCDKKYFLGLFGDECSCVMFSQLNLDKLQLFTDNSLKHKSTCCFTL